MRSIGHARVSRVLVGAALSLFAFSLTDCCDETNTSEREV